MKWPALVFNLPKKVFGKRAISCLVGDGIMWPPVEEGGFNVVSFSSCQWGVVSNDYGTKLLFRFSIPFGVRDSYEAIGRSLFFPLVSFSRILSFQSLMLLGGCPPRKIFLGDLRFMFIEIAGL